MIWRVLSRDERRCCNRHLLDNPDRSIFKVIAAVVQLQRDAQK